MGESLKSEKVVREYLLGRVSNETTLEGIEELLFTDEEFCSQVELAEEGIINDYVFGRLAGADAESFQATLAGNPEKRFKLELTQALREKALAANLKAAEAKPSVFASLKAFFRQPMYVGAFAVLLIAVVALTVYFSKRGNPDELAELRSVYRQARPTETRISEFDYAPLPQLRGATEPGAQSRLRRIEINLIDAADKNSTAQTHHALGVYYLTQQKYRDAIREFESALKLGDKSAKTHNDLGAAHFELARSGLKEKRLEELSQSLEEFTKATKLDGNLLEALFNKSLALQELAPREAKDSWTLYLQKDPASPWADEARKNLKRIESEQPVSRSDKEVLTDFLTAYRQPDHARAQKIHDETKGLLRNSALPLQLSRRYLLARQRGDEADAKESIEALTFIGNIEKTKNGDSFFFELANFYARVRAHEIEPLLLAKDIFTNALQLKTDYDRAITDFEKSRDIFERLGDVYEAEVAENWAAQFLLEVGKVAEGRRRFSALMATAASRNFKILLPPAYYWLGFSDYHQNGFSETNKNFKIALRFAEAGNNAFEVQHTRESLVESYSGLGELGTALFYANKLLPDEGLYYQSDTQDVRNKGALAALTLKLKFFATSASLSQEHLRMVQTRSPNSSRVNDSLSHLVAAAIGSEDFSAAFQYALESKTIALGRSESKENIHTTAEVYLLLAELKSQTNDCSQALPDYDKALELYSRLQEFTVSLYQIHKGKLFCFEQLNRQGDFADELKTVLELSEQYRATIREDSSRQSFFANEQDVFDAAIQNALKEHDSEAAIFLAEKSKARSLLDFVESGKSIAEVEKDFGPVAQPLALAQIRSRLPDQVEVLQYAMLRDRLAIWIVSKTRFDLVEKEITATDLIDKVDAYQALIADRGSPAELRHMGQELYELLIPPGLTFDKQLCVIPDKALHQLAFATLVSPSGKYLLEDHALFYAPSASVLVLASENARRKEQVGNESLMSIGNPDFDREDNPNLADLRDAEDEARTIAGGYERHLELLGKDATRERFLHDFGNVEVIHFAGHFVANRQSPGNSKLLFAGGDLRSAELSGYKLPRVKLVVLSACETGFELYNQSEGAIGIARTWLAMGAPLVVASQWQVDSEPTKDLMVAFHRNRKQKGTSAESLRQAQLEVLSRNETKAPFYWAAFALFGGYANY